MLLNKNIYTNPLIVLIYFNLFTHVLGCLPPAGQCCSTPTCTNAPPCSSTGHSGRYFIHEPLQIPHKGNL